MEIVINKNLIILDLNKQKTRLLLISFLLFLTYFYISFITIELITLKLLLLYFPLLQILYFVFDISRNFKKLK